MFYFKVTVYLQGCLAYQRCCASGLNCRYLNPGIKLKLIGLAIRLYQKFWKKTELPNFLRLLYARAGNTFWTLQVKANFVFRLFNVFLRFRGQGTKKTCLRFAIFNFNEKLHWEHFYEIGLKKHGVIVQKSLLQKQYLGTKNSQTNFHFLLN